MKFVIQIIGYAADIECPHAGQYLEWFDPDIADPSDEMGGFTADPTKAKRFATASDAFREWNRVRTVDPVRPDGRLNKPLTAFSIEVRRIDGGPQTGER